MRRSALQLARLPGSSAGVTAAAAPALCSSVGWLLGVPSAAAAAGGGQPSSSSGGSSGGAVAAAAAAALAPWRPFSASSTATLPQNGADWSRQRQQTVDPDSPLGLLAACNSVQQMRSWRDALQAEGRFGAEELAVAIRAVGQRQELPLQARREYLHELLAAAADGSVKLDGKSAAYLLWGPVKCGLSGKDPAVQRVMPIVFQYIDNMQTNDLSTCVWAMGLLDIAPSESVREQLLSRLVPALPEMRVKELTAAAGGVTRLGLQDFVGQALMEAFESKVDFLSTLPYGEIERIVKVMPYVPGMQPDSQFAVTVFSRALRKSPRLPLSALCETVWAAGRIQYRFSDADLKRMLNFIEQKLADNIGTQVQALLHGLASLECHASDTGPLTHSFLEQCAESQLKAEYKAGSDQNKIVKHLSKTVLSMGMLQARLPDALLQRILDALQEAGLEHVKRPFKLQFVFKRLGFQPGVAAMEEFTKKDKAGLAASKHSRRKERQRQRQASGSHEHGIATSSGEAAALAPLATAE